MTEAKILEETPISMTQLKDELKGIKKRDTELSFRAEKLSEQLESLSLIKQKDAEELFKAIEKLNIPRLKDIHIYKIIDLMPANITELRNIIQGYGLTVTNDNLDKILKAVAEYLPKKK